MVGFANRIKEYTAKDGIKLQLWKSSGGYDIATIKDGTIISTICEIDKTKAYELYATTAINLGIKQGATNEK